MTKFGDQSIMPHEKSGLARDIISGKEGASEFDTGGEKLDRVECEACDGGGYVVHTHHKPPESKKGEYMPGKHTKVAHADAASAIEHMSKVLHAHHAKHGGKKA